MAPAPSGLEDFYFGGGWEIPRFRSVKLYLAKPEWLVSNFQQITTD
jgi:hypothetical protein